MSDISSRLQAVTGIGMQQIKDPVNLGRADHLPDIGDAVAFTNEPGAVKWYKGTYGGETPMGKLLVLSAGGRVYSVSRDCVVAFGLGEQLSPKKPKETEKLGCGQVVIIAMLFASIAANTIWIGFVQDRVLRNETWLRVLHDKALLKELSE